MRSVALCQTDRMRYSSIDSAQHTQDTCQDIRSNSDQVTNQFQQISIEFKIIDWMGSRNSPVRNPLDSPHLSFPPTSNSSPMMDGNTTNPSGSVQLNSSSPRTYRVVSKSPDFEPHNAPRAKGKTPTCMYTRLLYSDESIAQRNLNALLHIN